MDRLPVYSVGQCKTLFQCISIGYLPLDEITGATTTDDILNLIFGTFCIGK